MMNGEHLDNDIWLGQICKTFEALKLIESVKINPPMYSTEVNELMDYLALNFPKQISRA